MTEKTETIETKLMMLTSSDYHESIGIYPMENGTGEQRNLSFL